jgi:hypothetical protein
MRPIKQTVTAGEIGSWIPLDRKSNGTAGFMVAPHTSSAGTYDVEFTTSNLQKPTRNAYSRSTTTLTITATAHGLTTADACIVTGNDDFEGQYEIAGVTDADNITVTVADSGGTAGSLGFIPVRVDTITGFSGASGRASGNLFASVTGIRLDAGSVTTANIDFELNQVEV